MDNFLNRYPQFVIIDKELLIILTTYKLSTTVDNLVDNLLNIVEYSFLTSYNVNNFNVFLWCTMLILNYFTLLITFDYNYYEQNY